MCIYRGRKLCPLSPKISKFKNSDVPVAEPAARDHDPHIRDGHGVPRPPLVYQIMESRIEKLSEAVWGRGRNACLWG